MDPTQFRTDFPEFSNTTVYPDSLISYWINVATLMLNACQWGSMLNTGIELYTAHEITLAAQNQAIATNGGNPGGTSGPTASKAVGGVNVSYDTQQTAEKDAGYWNLTTYGKKYIRLARMFGMGAVQL